LLAQVQACDSDEFIIQADVSKPEDIRHMFNTVQAEFGSLDIFVGNARPEVPNFFYPPMEITLQQWDIAFDSQARAFLLAAREAARLMPDGAEYWRSPTALAAAPAACSRGFRWARPRRRWRRWCVTLPSPADPDTVEIRTPSPSVARRHFWSVGVSKKNLPGFSLGFAT
jgi:NAD(P)-dependent dehydrogenase (short-subunit alcohol dehydrogenase family)